MEVCSHVSLTKYWLIGLCRFAKYDVEIWFDAVDVERAVPAMREYRVPVLSISSSHLMSHDGTYSKDQAQRPATTHSAYLRLLATTPSPLSVTSWGVEDIDILLAVGELTTMSLSSIDLCRI